MVKLSIDNREIFVEEGTTVLQAARANGIAIPTLCYLQALEPYAACRLCLVELTSARGKLVASCAQVCEEGMKVLTDSPRVLSARRLTAELLMASGAHLPLVRELAQSVGVDRVRCTLPPDDCVLCGLCVRACDELVGAHAISLVRRGLQRNVAPPFEITSAACIGCATCVLICPTGAISLRDISATLPSLLEKGAGGLGHDVRTCRVCGEQTLPAQFADINALFPKEVQRV